PRPTSARLIARLIDAPMLKSLPAMPSQKASTASATDAPVAAMISRPIPSAITVDTTGTSTCNGTKSSLAPCATRASFGFFMTMPNLDMPVPRHHRPDRLAAERPGRKFANQLSAVNHRDPIRHRHQLLELAGDQEHSKSVIAGGADAIVNGLDRANV